MTPDPLPIADAVQLYCDARENELSAATLQSHRYRLNHIIRWSENHDDVTTTADLNGRRLLEYRTWREQDGDLSTVSLHTQLSTLRVWLKFLATVEVVPSELHTKLSVPSMDGSENVNDEAIPKAHCEAIDTHLQQFQYASPDHILWSLLYGTGIRIGAVHGIDVDDVEMDDKRLWLRHRPDTETTLKNGSNGERPITLSDTLVQRVCDYVEHTRPPTTDSHGRRPLLVRSDGRPSKSTLRRMVYRLCQPCQIGRECPHGTTKHACEIAGYTDEPSGCPSIYSPHQIRKRVIIDYRKDEIPDAYISDRCDVNQRTMDEHYDVRTPAERQSDRADYFS